MSMDQNERLHARVTRALNARLFSFSVSWISLLDEQTAQPSVRRRARNGRNSAPFDERFI
jgi:hypothetical protein